MDSKSEGKIIFRSIDRKEVLILENFKFLDNSINKFVLFSLTIYFDIFNAKSEFECELDDFNQLQNDLIKMYNFELKTFWFLPIEKKIELKFDLLKTGHIEIEGRINNQLYTGRFEFNFETDQTFLPEIIEEINQNINKRI